MRSVVAILIVLLFISTINAEALPLNVARFDFQIDAGEGTVELYRIDYDFNKKNGELCFLNTGSSGIAPEMIERIRKGELWSKLIEMMKESHACFKFDAYDPFGWFYSSPIMYEKQTYVFFFTGDMNKDRIKGVIYQFITIQERLKQYRITEEREIEATAVTKNK